MASILNQYCSVKAKKTKIYSKRLEFGLFYNITHRLKASPRCGERFGEGFHIWLNYKPFAVYTDKTS
jgi:hypothetical protein